MSAQRFNTTVNAIIAANPGVNPNALRISQTICIPQPCIALAGEVIRFNREIASPDKINPCLLRGLIVFNVILKKLGVAATVGDALIFSHPPAGTSSPIAKQRNNIPYFELI